MDKTMVMAEFSVTGDSFNPEDITQELKLVPTKFWTKGEKTGITCLPKQHTYWEINTGYEESLDINNQLIKVFNLLNDKMEILKVIKDKHNVEFTICIVIRVEKGEVPAMYIEHYFINFVHEIKARIEFDFYYFS